MIKSISQTLITGVYRSGTEYISNLLGSHPDLSVNMYHVNALRFLLGRFDPIQNKKNYVAAVQYTADRIMKRYHLELDCEQVVCVLESCDRVTYGVLYDVLMTSLHLSENKFHWAEKCQLLWRQIPYFLDSMKNGFSVHIVRDPRSVLASFKKFTNAEYPLYLISVFNSYDSMSSIISNHDERVVVIRFEDALRQPFVEANKLWEKLGINEVDESVFMTSQWKDAYGMPWKNNSSFQGESALFNKQIAEQSTIGLSDSEIAFVEHVCGYHMEKLGYELLTKTNYNETIGVVQDNDVLRAVYEHWSETGEGVQQFPSDPFDPKTWSK